MVILVLVELIAQYALALIGVALMRNVVLRMVGVLVYTLPIATAMYGLGRVAEEKANGKPSELPRRSRQAKLIRFIVLSMPNLGLAAFALTQLLPAAPAITIS